LELDWTIIDNAAVSRLNAAAANMRLSAANRDQYQSDLTYVMLVTFLNTQRLRKKLDVIEDNLKRDKEIVDFATAKVRSGAGLRIDLMRARGLLEKDNLKKIDTNVAYMKSHHDLGTLLGEPHLTSDLEPLAFHETDVPGGEKTSLRPDLQAAHFTVAASRELKEEAEHESSGKFSFYSNAGVVGTHVVGGVGSAVTGSLGLQFVLPVLDGGYFSAKVQEMSVKTQQAELQAKQLDLEADSQVQVARAQLHDARSAVDGAHAQMEIANEELRLARRRYASGVASGLEVTSAQTSLGCRSRNRRRNDFWL